MIPPDAALERVLDVAERLPCRSIPAVDACGLELAEPVLADRDYPPFPRAMMDGYAVRLADAGRSVPVVAELAAGQSYSATLTSGQAIEIMTGAACPDGTEAVVQKEETRRIGNRVQLPEQISGGQHIAPRGSECRAGMLVLRPGEIITPLAVAVMASFGLESVKATPRPTLAVIATGSELVTAGEQPSPARIRDSNGPMLVSAARDLGLDPPVYQHAADRMEALRIALEQASSRDLVLLSGGVSVGSYDLVPEALRAYGAETVFHKVRQKPGKPLLFARKGAQLIFGLPGNPLACHLCFYRYVAAAARRMAGKPASIEQLHGVLSRSVESRTGRTFFVPAQSARAPDREAWILTPLSGLSSADMFACASANCYLELAPGRGAYAAGETVPFSWIGSAPWQR